MDFFQRENCMENGAKNFLDPGIGEGKANAVCAPTCLQQGQISIRSPLYIYGNNPPRARQPAMQLLDPVGLQLEKRARYGS